MVYDNNRSHQETVYEGGHRISRDEARAYASLLNDEIEELQDRLEEEYVEIEDSFEHLWNEMMEVFDSAKRDLEEGLEAEQVQEKYDENLSELNRKAEDAFDIEGNTPLDLIQSKIYQKDRWLKIVENHERASTSNKEYSMFTDTVRKDIRNSGSELEKMKASYLPFKEVIENLEYIKENFPSILDQEGEGRRDPEFTDRDLEEYLHDSDN